MRPSATARNRSTAFRPGLSAMLGAFQKRCTRSRCAGSSKSMWAASMLARPPTSRPPMALGWPVTENGPMPGLADAAGGQMAVDDGVDLVGAVRRLVDALAVDGDRTLGRRRTARRTRAVRPGREPGLPRRRAQGRAPRPPPAPRRSRWCVPRCSRGRARRCRARYAEQADEQRDVAVRRDRQMQVGDLGGHRCGADRSARPASRAASPCAAAMRW